MKVWHPGFRTNQQLELSLRPNDHMLVTWFDKVLINNHSLALNGIVFEMCSVPTFYVNTCSVYANITISASYIAMNFLPSDFFHQVWPSPWSITS
jgi:hypothetical protein